MEGGREGEREKENINTLYTIQYRFLGGLAQKLFLAENKFQAIHVIYSQRKIYITQHVHNNNII